MTTIISTIITLLGSNLITLFITMSSVRKRERAIAKTAIEQAKQAAISTEKQKLENLIEKLKTYNIYIEDLDMKATSMIKKYNDLQIKYDILESNYDDLERKYHELEDKYNSITNKKTVEEWTRRRK